MMMCLIYLALVLVLSAQNGSTENFDCTAPLVKGITCSNSTSSIRWFYDEKLAGCYPYRFSGCNEGLNSFISQDDCYAKCKPADHFTCGANTAPQGVCISYGDPACKKGSICVVGGMMGFCCDKEVQDAWNNEQSPKCEKGKIVQVNQWYGKVSLIGRNCTHDFCPAGSKCHQGKWTAYCCQ